LIPEGYQKKMDFKKKLKTLTQIEKLENFTPGTIWYLLEKSN
jgi:hypothetical protein